MDGKTILVVDDDESIRATVSHYLKQTGCKIIPSHSGKNALHLIKNELIDFVICDVQMPDGDGRWLIQQLHHMKMKPSNFCFYSSNPQFNEECALQLGADAYFEKFQLGELRSWVRERLKEAT